MGFKIPVNNSVDYYWIGQKQEIMIVNNKENILIYNSICPHMGARLTYNFLKSELTCPWHGLSFNNKLCSNHHKYKVIKQFNFIYDEKNNELILPDKVENNPGNT